MTIKIAVVSDIRIYCEGIARVLADTQLLSVSATASNFDRAWESIRVDKPDILLLDMTMQGGREFTARVLDAYPTMIVVALAVPDDNSQVVAYAKAGIVGYVPRDASIEELVETLIGASKGKFSCPLSVAHCILSEVSSGALRAQPRDVDGETG